MVMAAATVSVTAAEQAEALAAEQAVERGMATGVVAVALSEGVGVIPAVIAGVGSLVAEEGTTDHVGCVAAEDLAHHSLLWQGCVGAGHRRLFGRLTGRCTAHTQKPSGAL